MIRITYTAFESMAKDQGGKGGVIVHFSSLNGKVKPTTLHYLTFTKLDYGQNDFIYLIIDTSLDTLVMSHCPPL